MTSSSGGPVTGWWQLARLQLRNDRVRLPVWLVGITAVTGASANAAAGLYDTPAEQAGYAATVEHSAISRLMGGVPRDVDTLGGIIAFEVTAVAATAAALMVCFLVVRHTRAEEESGRAELVRAGVVGRHAALAATLLVALVASVLLGVLLGAVLVTADVPVRAATLFGAGMAATGLVFTGVSAAAAQVIGTARRALGLALAAVLAAYVVRGYGALDESVWTWLSPFGWQDELRPFGDDARWWPLALSLAATVVALAVASWLAAHRDFGAGLVAERPGPSRARARLGTPEGLAVRQLRGLLLGWGAGLLLLAAIFGGMSREVRTMLAASPDVAAIILAGTDDVVLGYLTYVTHFLGVGVASYAVVTALRPHRDEVDGYAEAVLSTGVSRVRWAVSGIAVTWGLSLGLLALVGLVLGLTHALVDDAWFRVVPLLGATLATAPSVLLLASLVVLQHGWRPRWVLLGWLPVTWALLEAYLGEQLDLPAFVRGLSPFHHLSVGLVEPVAVGPVLLQLALAVLLAALGVVGLVRRDLD